MAISINWATKVITVPKADLTLVSGIIYQHDVGVFQRELSEIGEGEAGIAHPPTHRHSTQQVLAGVTYARSVEIINGYTVTYESGSYRVNLVGANNNIIDVLNYNSVQVVANNSAGLIVKSVGSGVTPEDIVAIAQQVTIAVWSEPVAPHTDRSLIGGLIKTLLTVPKFLSLK